MLTPSQASLLRHISIGDETSLHSPSPGPEAIPNSLDARTAALVWLAALIVRDSSLASYQRAVNAALDAGVSTDEILSLLLVLAQPAGSTVIITAAPKLAMALGYDVEAGLEGHTL